MIKIKIIPVLVILLLSGTLLAQSNNLTIDDAYALAKQNYPLVKQKELISKSKEYSIQNASKAYLPQVSINGQATYQSAVTELPIQLPGVEIPSLSKDQYKVYAEVNQTLFDGGVVKQQKKMQEANAVAEEQKLEVELYKLKERINQLFFGTLFIDEQLKQNEILKKDIEAGIKKMSAAVTNGIAYKSSVDVLKAELLKANQRDTELKATRKAYLDMLSLFTNQTLTENTTLIKPKNIVEQNEIKRPELLFYDYQNKNLDVQSQLISAKNLPKFNLFFQGGYGRPALNMLSNSFEPYYIGGIRMNWSLSGLYTIKKDRNIVEINRQMIELQRETFLFNTNFTLKQQNAEISKLQELLTTDDEIITLRNNVKNVSSAQLENGVITSNDYLREVNAEDQAKQNKIVHEIQLLMAQYNQQTTIGN